MATEQVQRRLAAILAADVVGYSRLIGEDEAGTRARFNRILDDIVRPAIATHRGRVDDIVEDFVEPRPSSGLVLADQPRISDHVGREDGRQTALNLFRGHVTWLLLSASTRGIVWADRRSVHRGRRAAQPARWAAAPSAAAMSGDENSSDLITSGTTSVGWMISPMST